MPQPHDTHTGGSVSADTSRDHKSQRDTMLLSDLPDVAAIVADATAASDPTPNLSAASLAALGLRYDILGEAGHGSMGNVYKARDRETGETVALKLLKPEIASDQAMMDRFKNELLFARKITHKNVCRVHDFNRIGAVAYTTMEFVEGESLRSAFSRFGGLPLRKGIQLALQICSGLREAHAQEIVHRDLKPENVMIDVQGNVKIMDFGIARSMEGAARLTGSMIGTPAYMAPEQVAGKAVDYRTDIYSLGLILYEMFTGAPTFSAEAPVAVALKQMRESPRPPHEIDPSIPVPLERALLKCLEKDPARRFQSIVELEAVLRSPAASIPTAGAGSAVAPAASAAAQPLQNLMLTPLPPRSYAPERKPRRAPFFIWVLLAASMVFGALAAVQVMSILKASDNIQAPSTRTLPTPPNSAFEKPVPQTDDAAPADTAPETNSKADAKNDAPGKTAKPAPPQPDLSVPEKPKAGAKHPAVAAARKPAPVLRQHAQTAAPPAAPAPSASTEENATYLWVGRFDHEEKALDVARRLRDLGLKVDIIPRHTSAGNFYAVFTGPYGSDRVTSVMQWLGSQGFHNVHQVTNPGAAKGGKQ